MFLSLLVYGKLLRQKVQFKIKYYKLFELREKKEKSKKFKI